MKKHTWMEYTAPPPADVEAKLADGGAHIGSDGYWWHRQVGTGKTFVRPAAQTKMQTGAGHTMQRSTARRGVGAGYTPEPGDYVVDANTAETLVAANGGWGAADSYSEGGGSWPAVMTQEATKNEGGTDVYIWCGVNKKIYQVSGAGTLLAAGDPGASFNPVAPPGTNCVAPQVWDPVAGKCLVPAAPTGVATSWWANLSTLTKGLIIGGGALVVGVVGYEVLKPKGAPHLHKKVMRAMR